MARAGPPAALRQGGRRRRQAAGRSDAGPRRRRPGGQGERAAAAQPAQPLHDQGPRPDRQPDDRTTASAPAGPTTASSSTTSPTSPAQSQNFDGNGPYLRLQPGGGDTLVGAVQPERQPLAPTNRTSPTPIAPPLGTQPQLGGRPPLKPDVRCYTNPVPDVNGRLGQVGAPSPCGGEPMTEHEPQVEPLQALPRLARPPGPRAPQRHDRDRRARRRRHRDDARDLHPAEGLAAVLGAASSAKTSSTSPPSSRPRRRSRPGQGQAVDIAGIQIGKVTSVDLEDGHAVVGMDIEPKYMQLIHPNATLLLRPKTNLNDMVVEVEPGSGKGHIEDGANFPLSQTEPNTNLDAFLATLDGDTRQYLQLLVAGGAQGIGGRGRQLSGAFRRLQPFVPLHRQAQRRRRQTPRRARPRDPRLRPADHRTRPPRRRDPALRHLLRRRPRQLRQPAAVDPGRAARVPGDPAGGAGRPRQLQPLLDRRPARRCSA